MTCGRKTDLFKVGDILVCTWGYGQTNVNFFKVKRTTEKSVWLVQINTYGVTKWGQKKKYKYTDGEGYCMPDPKKVCEKSDDLFGLPGPKRIGYDACSGEPYVKIFSHAKAYRWNGKPIRESWYY